jgi:hypothetical protein
MGLPVPQPIVEAFKGSLEIKYNHFLARAMMVIIAFFIAWPVAGALFFVIDIQYYGYSTVILSWLVITALFFVRAKIKQKREFSDFEKGIAKATADLSSSVGSVPVDYYCSVFARGVALCLQDNSLHLLSDNMEGPVRGTGGVVRKFPLSALQGVAAIKTEGETVTPIGHVSLTAQQDIRRHNASVRRTAAINTGLLFEFDDIDYPKVFMTIPIDAAQKLERVLQKAKQGTLEPQTSRRLVW